MVAPRAVALQSSERNELLTSISIDIYVTGIQQKCSKLAIFLL